MALGLRGIIVPASAAVCSSFVAPAAGTGGCDHPLFDHLEYVVGAEPHSVAIGDLDGVNGPDLVVANLGTYDQGAYQGDNVSVLFNQGDGTFLPPVAYVAGEAPFSAAIGDLDGVNGPDVVVTNPASDEVRVLLNQGDGTLTAAVAYGAGDQPYSVAIGDLDGVNGADLAVANRGQLDLGCTCVLGDDVSVLFNQGDGTFAPGVAYLAGEAPHSVAIGDLDGVNGPDLAVVNKGALYSDGCECFVAADVSVLLNQGNGTFAPAVPYPAGEAPRSVAIGDLDGVNGPDLAIANVGPGDVDPYDGFIPTGGGAVALLNQGDGTFAPAVTYDAPIGPTTAAVADLDGTGGLDVALANSWSGELSLLLNQGDGTFGPAQDYFAAYPTALAVGDLDGLNGPDVAFTNGNVAVLLNQGDATFPAAPVSVVAGAGGVEEVAVGDLDGINGPDIAVVNDLTDQVSVLLNLGDGTYAAAVEYNAGSESRSLAIGDVDGINGVDIVTANRFGGDEVSVLLNNGDGTLLPAVLYDAGTWNWPWAVALGDLDGVNGPDIVVANLTGDDEDVSVLLNHGNGQFGGALYFNVSEVGGLTSVAIGDLDGVNGPDLVVSRSGHDDVAVLLQGTGQDPVPFGAAVTYAAGNHPESVAVGDLDGVNGPDIAVANLISDDLTVLLNQGDGTFAAGVRYDTDNEPCAVVMDDLDGVNGLDIAVANNVGVNVSVLLNHGDGTFAAATPYGAHGLPVSLAVADLNGDGPRDLALASTTSVAVLMNLCGASACPWDLGGDGEVGIGDLLDVLALWGTDPGGQPDFDGSGTVGIGDLLELLGHWGPCP